MVIKTIIINKLIFKAMNKFYMFLLFGLLTSLSAFSQVEVEDNDYFGEATIITNVGTLTGTTDADWQGDTWYLDFEPGEYQVSWTADAATRVRVIEYLHWFNPVVDDEQNTPGSSGDCTFANAYLGCFLIDNRETLSENISEIITISADNHFILFLNPHMATGLDYSITFSALTTDIKNNKIEENLNIYPNPTADYVTIKTNGNDNIIIYDVIGKQVVNVVSDSMSTKIDISHLPKGMYIVEIGNKTQKLIKQ